MLRTLLRGQKLLSTAEDNKKQWGESDIMTKAKKLNVTHEGAETEYFRFYKSFLDAMRGYDDEIQFRAFKFIANYGIYGIVPELRDGDVASTIFLLCKPYIDSAYRRAKNGQEHKAKTELEEAEPQEPRKRGRPKKAAAVPESTLDTDDADTPLFATTDEAAPAHTTELHDSGAEGQLLIDQTETEEITAADLRITPPKKQDKEQPKKEYGEHGNVLLTDEDLEYLISKHGKEDTEAAIDVMDYWIEGLDAKAKKEYKAKNHRYRIKWAYERVEEDREKARKKAADAGKVVPIMPPVNKNNFLNFEQNSLSAEELQELEAKLIEN